MFSDFYRKISFIGAKCTFDKPGRYSFIKLMAVIEI